jgi:CRP-like cAMP-binding protein
VIGPEYFLHTSNLARVVSFSAKDVMWLRIFAILASLIGVPYFYLQPAVLWEPIAWTLLSRTINGYHVWRLWLERRPVELSSDEARLYDLTFFPLGARQFLELVRLGRWTDLKPGEVVVRAGEPVNELAVPLTEGIEAKVGGRNLGRFPPGAIIGASALFDARLYQLEAVAEDSCRVLRLPVTAIRARAEGDNQLARTLDRIAREDLARKLEFVLTGTAHSTNGASAAGAKPQTQGAGAAG